MLLVASLLPRGRNALQQTRRHRLSPSSTSSFTPKITTQLRALDSKQLRFYGSEAYLSFPDLPDFLGRGSRTFLPTCASMATENGILTKLKRQYDSSSSSSSSHSSSSSDDGTFDDNSDGNPYRPIRTYGPYIELTPEEKDLFRLLRQARKETGLTTTLRVAGGWVRDKLLATREFAQASNHDDSFRLTSKFKESTTSVNSALRGNRRGGKTLGFSGSKPVDIDIALDDMLGREFADHLNEYFNQVGEDTVSVGVVLKNPEKSKHLETATMKVGTFWIDFVNLRAEQYTQDSRIPDLMRIGTPEEDAFRRDLTINALFYNINNGLIEDWTGRGFDDLRRGIVATPLAPLTTLLDDPLRTLRSIRFAARLRFTMDEALIEAAMDDRVRSALELKVSRERVGGELDLMLRSPDPVCAMRLLINLNLVDAVFPIQDCFPKKMKADEVKRLFVTGLQLMSTTYDHLCDCNENLPVWCMSKRTYATHGVVERTLMQDEKARRNLWYASFLKPVYDSSNKIPQAATSVRDGKKANRSVISKLLVDELKRPTRDAISVEKIMRGADEFTLLIKSGCDLSALSVLLSGIRVMHDKQQQQDEDGDHPLKCYMNRKEVFSATEEDPVWQHAMEFRLLCAKVMRKVGPLWRAALILSLSEQLLEAHSGELDYAIEGDVVSTNLFRLAFSHSMEKTLYHGSCCHFVF
jgi:tRNA nucleotidyltransferase/poly(A) polymerase